MGGPRRDQRTHSLPHLRTAFPWFRSAHLSPLPLLLRTSVLLISILSHSYPFPDKFQGVSLHVALPHLPGPFIVPRMRRFIIPRMRGPARVAPTQPRGCRPQSGVESRGNGLAQITYSFGFEL